MSDLGASGILSGIHCSFQKGPDQLAITGFDPYDERIMERAIVKGVCLLMVATLTLLPVSGTDLPEDKVEQVRTWMTIAGAALGLGIGIGGSLDLVPQGTPLSDSLLVVIPTVAASAATSALAGRWIAETALALRPTLVFSPLVGAGLGTLACCTGLCYATSNKEVKHDVRGLVASILVLGLLDLRVCRLLVRRPLLNPSIVAVFVAGFESRGNFL